MIFYPPLYVKETNTYKTLTEFNIRMYLIQPSVGTGSLLRIGGYQSMTVEGKRKGPLVKVGLMWLPTHECETGEANR